MFGLLAGILAAAGILLFIGIEMPSKMKDIFHKMPTWVSSSILSALVGYIIGGVTGGVACFVVEVILFPSISFLKSKNKKRRNVK